MVGALRATSLALCGRLSCVFRLIPDPSLLADITEHFSECFVRATFQYCHKLIEIIKLAGCAPAEKLSHEILHKGICISHIVFTISDAPCSVIVVSLIGVG